MQDHYYTVTYYPESKLWLWSHMPDREAAYKSATREPSWDPEVKVRVYKSKRGPEDVEGWHAPNCCPTGMWIK